jgi:Na+/H+ antiporter NhaD/arsenite permease-like protein
MRPIILPPRSALVDPVGGIFGSVVLILTLCTLVASSTLHPQLYLVAVPPAVMVLTRDIFYDLWTYRSRKLEWEVAFIGRRIDTALTPDIVENGSKLKANGANGEERHEGVISTDINLLDHDRNGPPPDLATDQGTQVGPSPKGQQASQERDVDRPKVDGEKVATEADAYTSESRQLRLNFLERTVPTFVTILKIMPFSLVVFSLSLFILVQGLAVTGWVDVWAGWWGTWTERTGLVGTVFGMGLVSCILCNVSPLTPLIYHFTFPMANPQVFGTNIGATILLARVLQVWIQTSSQTPSARLQDAAIYTLALGSNYGAFTFSFPASLAGLLWRKLLLAKGIKVEMSQFAKLNALPCAVAMGISCSVLIGEIYVIHR